MTWFVFRPVALYTLSPLIGPVLGPLLAGFINQHVYWRWTYHVLTIWFGVELVLIVLVRVFTILYSVNILISLDTLNQFIPETYAPLLIAQKAQRLRKETGDSRYFGPLERKTQGVPHTVKTSFYRPFGMHCASSHPIPFMSIWLTYLSAELMTHEPMLLLLDLWTSLVLGIVYLTFPIFPIIFGKERGFNQQSVGLSYLGIGLGMILALMTQPYWIKWVHVLEMRYPWFGRWDAYLWRRW